MTRKSPRTSAGLSMFAASIATPIAVPWPIRLCSSSMNRMHVAGGGRLRDDRADALLVLSAVRRAGEQRHVVERQEANLAKRRAARVPAAMRCASPSAIAVLPTPAGPTSVGLFLPCRSRMSMTRETSSSRQRTGSRRPARASAVRSRVKRARAPPEASLRRDRRSCVGGNGTRGDAGANVDEPVGLRCARGNGSTHGQPRLRHAPQARDSQASSASPQNNVSSAAGARNTPNGTSGVSNGGDPERELRLFARLVRVAASADRNHDARANATAPSVAPTKTVMSARVGPSAAPMNAMSVTSPSPIASRLGHDLAEPADDGDHARAGARADQCIVRPREDAGFARGKTPTNAVSSANINPNSVKPSGIR